MKNFLFGLCAGIVLTAFLQPTGENIEAGQSNDDKAHSEIPVEKAPAEKNPVKHVTKKTPAPKPPPAAPIKQAKLKPPVENLPLPQDKLLPVSPSPQGTDAAPSQVRFTAPAPRPAAPVIVQPAGPAMFVTGSKVNLRAGPSLKAPVQGQSFKGQQVTVLAREGGWAKITTGQDRSRTAWISAQFLAARPPAAAPKPVRTSQRRVAAPTSGEVTRARKDIISQSVRAYQGSCPCPYNTDRAGRRCGKRSAWSRPGGASPICYDSDVSPARLTTYLARKRGAVN